eukprot:jgi/Ulvmu1/1343/UM011_0071.1
MLREDGYQSVGLETGDVLEVFQILYQSGGCIEAFHKEKGTRLLAISPWHAGSREVKYELSIKAPAFVTNIVGSDLSVKEAQTVTWMDALGNTVADPFHAASTPTVASSDSTESVMDGPASYTINSVPVIQTTGSDRFVTELAFKFAKAPNTQTVSVSCSLQVEAKIWGLQSTLEPYMLSEAKKQLAQFVPFLAAYFREYGGAPMLSAVPDAGENLIVSATASSDKAQDSSPSSIAAAIDLLSQASRSSSEHFYDALEEVPKGVRAAVQIFEAAKEEVAPRKSTSGRLPGKSPKAWSRASLSPLAHPPSPLPRPRPAAVETKAPVTPPELAGDLPVEPPATGAVLLRDENAKLQLECAALRLEAAERRFQGLADATEVCLQHLQHAVEAPAAPAAAPELPSWGSGVGLGFVVGVVFGFGAAAALTWGSGRSAVTHRGGR